MTARYEGLEPIDWRPTCKKCGRFIAHNRTGTVYAPWGDKLQYDGYQDVVNCDRCGIQEMGMVPARWVQS